METVSFSGSIRDSVSAASMPIFATKAALFKIFPALHDPCKMSSNCHEFCQRCLQNLRTVHNIDARFRNESRIMMQRLSSINAEKYYFSRKKVDVATADREGRNEPEKGTM